MDIIKWQTRLARFKASPQQFIKTFYYMRIAGLFNFMKRKETPKEYFEEMTLFTQNYLVNSMRLGEEYIWPYLRGHLWVNLNNVAIGKTRGVVLPYSLQGGHYSQIPHMFREEIKKEMNAVEINDLKEREVDFLFFINTNGTEQISINDEIYHRITDPFYEEAIKHFSALKIEIVKNGSITIEKWHNYMHKSKLILPPAIQKLGYHHRLSMDGRFFNLFKRYIPSLKIQNKIQLNNIINYELHTRSYYLKILKKLKPKVICLYGFHYMAPLISAADELGILTVDLQHGLQVGWNPLYNNYDELPSSGYQALPDYFAVWGEKEYKNIQQTFKSKKHKPIYMGNPWLKRLETFSHPLSQQLLNKFDDSKIKILIIMQNQPSIPQLFIDIINNTSNDIQWVVRHHPKGERYKAKDFSKNDKSVLVDEEIDNVLFNELFKYIDIAISEGSALALEASHYGVANIICSQMGLENYKQEIEDNIFYYLQDANEFKTILKDIEQSVKSHSYKPFKEINTGSFLNELLKSSNVKQCKKDSLNLNILPSKEQAEEITNQVFLISLQANSNEVEHAIKNFYKLRVLLNKTKSIPFLIARDTDIWRKEARVFQRHIRESQEINNPNVIMIGDSLGMPRPHEIQMKNYGVEYTSTHMFNTIAPNFLSMITWAQRFMTTQKLLDEWELIAGEASEKHLVIHLGLNDSVERIFLEGQRLSLSVYSTTTRNETVAFGKKYRKEIIKSQKDHAYVPYEKFKSNLETITKKAISQNVTSLTFVNIIAFPESHEKDTPGSLENTQRFNDLFVDLKMLYPIVNVIDMNALVRQHGFKQCMLEDDMHLNHYGHKLLAKTLFSTLKLQHKGKKDV